MPGKYMMNLARELWPINRSLSGQGVRESLSVIASELPSLSQLSVESGGQAFDWIVPEEWSVLSATLTAPDGKVICDYSKNNLSLLGYSSPIDAELQLEELQQHLFCLPSQPEATPYVTSYYEANWGFCLPHKLRETLPSGTYKVKIDTKLFAGKLDYAELLIKGKTKREVFFSTYICHPSMANNELSGPVLAVALARYLQSISTHYSYRFVFIPETIGSLAYMSKNLEAMKKDVVAGFVLTCVGDERAYSYIPSRSGKEVSDKIALKSMEDLGLNFLKYSWGDRGSDERQYCSPGADLPICSVMRSKYGEYPEYHTSLDRLDTVMTESGLQESYELYKKIISTIEDMRFPLALQVGEPQLGKRGLYPNTSVKDSYAQVTSMVNVLSQCDGKQSVLEIAATCGIPINLATKIIEQLRKENLVIY